MSCLISKAVSSFNALDALNTMSNTYVQLGMKTMLAIIIEAYEGSSDFLRFSGIAEM